MKRKAFITGINGQDGSYLTELLLQKGYEVHGIIRRVSVFNTERIEHLMSHPDLKLYHGDITDSSNVNHLIEKIRPEEIYNLSAQSHVAISFEIPEYTAQVDAMGTLRILEAMRSYCPQSKFYQASTSELYGKVQETPQKETTPFYPRSPYGVAKLYAYWIVKNYREAYNLFAVNGILFNHESERRAKNFVTRKITNDLCEVFYGLKNSLRLGNLEARRDWGYAKEYCDAMWLMLQQNSPEDFVIATGKQYSVRQFIEMAAKHLGWEMEWRGTGADEKGYDKNSGKLIVEIDHKYLRPSEVETLIGDASLAKQKLGWQPKVDIQELISIMMKHDMQEVKRKTIKV